MHNLIVSALQDCPLTVPQLAEMIDCDFIDLYDYLADLMLSGTVSRFTEYPGAGINDSNEVHFYHLTEFTQNLEIAA